MNAIELPFVSASTGARVSPSGRYAGRVARRDAPAMDAPEEVREVLARTWLAQAATEARVGRAFACIERSLRALNADAAIIKLAHRAADDEARHAALCESVAGSYVGAPLGPFAALDFSPPEHKSAPPLLRHVLHVVGQCCLNETFASVYLSCAKRGATESLASFALRELLADEIDHARIGWAFVQTLPETYREALSDWLVPLVACNLREWRALDLPESDRLAAFGIPPREYVDAELVRSLEGVLIPGFAKAGLHVEALARFCAIGAPSVGGVGH